MNAIGSIVVYNGQYYINGMNGIQPVWGVQEFAQDDVTTVMENARSSLDLAQFIIDRLVNRKNEIYAIRNSNFIKEKLIKV